MPIKGSAITMQYVAWNGTTNTGQTGDVANHTIRAVGDGAEFTPVAAPVEVDPTNLKGVYKIAIAAGENNYDVVTLGGKSTTANVSIIPITWMNSVTASLTAPTIASIVTGVLTTQMTESYNADGVAPTLAQAVFLCTQRLTDFGISGTALTVRKIDGTTTAYGLTLDSATAPTSSTRTS
jgi:hypothetical protein